MAVVLAAALAGALVLGGASLVRSPEPTGVRVDTTGAVPVPTTAAVPRSGERERPPRRGRAEGRRASVVDRAAGAIRTRPAGTARLRPQRTTVPTRLRVPTLGLRMPVRPTGVDGRGLMALPATPFTAGWYRWGSAPRDPRGAVVVAGHVDTAEHGIGPLAGIAALRPDALLVVEDRRGPTRYRVVAVRRVPKRVLDLPALFRRTGPATLHLVTCGGEFDPVRRSYEDNVVVVAERVR